MRQLAASGGAGGWQDNLPLVLSIVGSVVSIVVISKKAKDVVDKASKEVKVNG